MREDIQMNRECARRHGETPRQIVCRQSIGLMLNEAPEGAYRAGCAGLARVAMAFFRFQ